MKSKHQLDLAVSTMLNMKKADVSATTALFCMLIMNCIVEDGEVHIDGFGRFRLTVSHGKRASVTRLNRGNFKKGESLGEQLVAVEKKYTVTFKKAAPFRQRIRKRHGKAPIIKE